MLGTRLEVGVTIDDQVNKGPGRPLFSVEERIHILRHLRFVDWAFPSFGAVDSIRKRMPNIYVKGIEYRDQDIPERAVCEELGIELVFLDTKPVYSSTRIMTGEMLRERIASA